MCSKLKKCAIYKDNPVIQFLPLAPWRPPKRVLGHFWWHIIARHVKTKPGMNFLLTWFFLKSVTFLNYIHPSIYYNLPNHKHFKKKDLCPCYQSYFYFYFSKGISELNDLLQWDHMQFLSCKRLCKNLHLTVSPLKQICGPYKTNLWSYINNGPNCAT